MHKWNGCTFKSMTCTIKGKLCTIVVPHWRQRKVIIAQNYPESNGSFVEKHKQHLLLLKGFRFFIRLLTKERSKLFIQNSNSKYGQIPFWYQLSSLLEQKKKNTFCLTLFLILGFLCWFYKTAWRFLNAEHFLFHVHF